MKKTCPRCGIVPLNHVCPYMQRNRRRKQSDEGEIERVRNSGAWQRKREAIKQRDLYLCRVCLHDGRYNGKKLEVHHIIPLCETLDYAFDDDYLITLCSFHHKQADKGKISRKTLLEYIPPG